MLSACSFHPLRPALLAALLGCCAAARAETVATELGRVEVSGAASVAPERVATRWVLTSQDIAARGARTLDEALALVPGLNVRTGAEGVPRIDIRGLRTRQIKLLIDGIPFNAAGDGQFDPTLIPVALIDSIVVTTGAASVLYGEGGTAGVVEIRTRSGRGALAGSAGLQAGSGGERIAPVVR